MASLKTVVTSQNPEQYVNAIEHPQRRADAEDLLQIFNKATSLPAKMWGKSIVGYGAYSYMCGKDQNQWMMTGFSVGKTKLSIYIMPGFEEYQHLLHQLGKHKVGKSCLYINKLADVDSSVLTEIIAQAFEDMKAKYN